MTSYKEPNLYTLLDIQPDSSNLELLLAFVLRAHEATPDEQNVNYQQLYLAAIAYSILSNTVSRKRYDIQLRNGEGQQIEFTLQNLFDSLAFLGNLWIYLTDLIQNCWILVLSIACSYIGYLIMPSESYTHIHMLVYCDCVQIAWTFPIINWRYYLK